MSVVLHVRICAGGRPKGRFLPRFRKGAAPRTLATLRNVAINLLRLAGAKNIAAGLRECGRSWTKALRLVGLQTPVASF